MAALDVGSYQFPSVPDQEIESLIGEIRQEMAILECANLASRYRRAGFEPIVDPFSPLVVDAIREAIIEERAFSLIRIGDSEVSFLAFGENPETPTLDRVVFEQAVMRFTDRFRLTESWMEMLQSMMLSSVRAADAVGVIGLWRAKEVPPEKFADHLAQGMTEDVRGMSGQWRGRRSMLKMAETGSLDNKLICAAHMYLGLVNGLSALVEAASGTICITNRMAAVERLRNTHPESRIEHIVLRSDQESVAALRDHPSFLWDIQAQLPQKMSGQLVLIGAGAWAEFYCTWVKERGGIAVDIGSGFDLLGGTVSRPIHKAFLETRRLSLEDFLNG